MPAGTWRGLGIAGITRTCCSGQKQSAAATLSITQERLLTLEGCHSAYDHRLRAQRRVEAKRQQPRLQVCMFARIQQPAGQGAVAG
jgi:hypothetical protein